jgi:hypothetical protein
MLRSATKPSLANPTIWLVAFKLLVLAAVASYMTNSYAPNAGIKSSGKPRQLVDRSTLTKPRHNSGQRPGAERKPILNATQQQQPAAARTSTAEPQLGLPPSQPKSYFAVCTIVKDQHQDLLEWIEWHRRGCSLARLC